jgi:hypothetical protein
LAEAGHYHLSKIFFEFERARYRNRKICGGISMHRCVITVLFGSRGIQ